jgi:hypothetical protein
MVFRWEGVISVKVKVKVKVRSCINTGGHITSDIC